ncbi:MAG TPA: DUF2092 domain-containing protein, partial [Verrucomicrobium sp.]|nr:DUF2092 domain-containing protein [Verrucomicrobium sp.]
MKTNALSSLQKASMLMLALFATSGPSMSEAAEPRIEPAAAALAKATGAKLGNAKTVRLTAQHKVDPALGVGAKLENGPLHITLQRPNQFYVQQPAGDQTRELAYDGRTLCLMQPVVNLHALEPVKASSVEQIANAMDDRFGFRPPVAELLSADFEGQLFLDVTSAKVVGTEWVGWTRCDRLHFEQDGMT